MGDRLAMVTPSTHGWPMSYTWVVDGGLARLIRGVAAVPLFVSRPRTPTAYALPGCTATRHESTSP